MDDDNQDVVDEINYTLLKPFDYSFSGQIKSAKFVTIKAPTVSNISSVAKLKQGFMRAITGNSQAKENVIIDTSSNVSGNNDDNEGGLDDLTGDQILAALSISDVDYARYLETAKTVFTETDLCLIEGEIKFNKVLIKKLCFDDLEGMTGEYLRVFILSSVLRMMQT